MSELVLVLDFGGQYKELIARTVRALYGADEVNERHRHRFEFNNDYREQLAREGLVVCGTSRDGALVEAVELPCSRFFIGVQFHPEFKSRPNKPHPIFLGFIRAAVGR